MSMRGMGQNLGADGGGGRQGERGEGEQVERLEKEFELEEDRRRTVAAMRWMSSKVTRSMSLHSRRCRRRRHGAGDDADGAGGMGASSWMGRGRRRPELRRRRRRGVSEPKVFLLLKQVGEGTAEARRKRGVLHAGTERW